MLECGGKEEDKAAKATEVENERGSSKEARCQEGSKVKQNPREFSRPNNESREEPSSASLASSLHWASPPWTLSILASRFPARYPSPHQR